ncbi:MAG: hypothetical protein AUK47_16145 [Deltaproteobacteria bacterium CG2_30_63_29]|nr:MAG: hypothetical protein AUK47_16145 [Deltaproteobacteria bacterium CG2_30_63_29]
MKTKTLLLALSLLLATLTFLLHTASCTLVYTGCTKDDECKVAAGEKCIVGATGHGECGLPSDWCDDGAQRNCIDVDPNYQGICVAKVATCVAGVWEVCVEAEICDGLDNDCNGRVDDGVTGVNDLCSVGIGACAAQGQQYCTAAQELVCNATALQPTGQIGCDCSDNNCDGVEDDYTLELEAPLLNPVPVEAARSDWSFAVTSTGHYVAAESATTPNEINIINSDTNELIGTTTGRAPILMASPTHGLVLFYIASNQDIDPLKLQDEVFLRAIDPLTMTFGEEFCKGCDEFSAVEGGPAVSFDVLYLCSEDSPNTSATPRCSDGNDNDNDGVEDYPNDEGCDGAEDNSEADCAFAIMYVRGTNHWIQTARVYEPSLNTMINSVGSPLHNMNFDTDVLEARINLTESLVFTAWVGTDVANNGLLQLVSGQLRHRYFPKNMIVVEANISTATDFDLVGLPSSEAVIAWTSGATIKIQKFQIVTEGERKDMIPIYAAVVVSPQTTGDSISNVEIELLCSERALMTYEVTSGVNSVVESMIFDVRDGSTLLAPTTSLAGTSPLLMKTDMGTFFGALRPAAGDTLPTGVPVIPGLGEIACDRL